MEAAAKILHQQMSDQRWAAGLIALDHTGAWATPHTTDRMYWHAVTPAGQGAEPSAATHASFHTDQG